MMMTTTMDAHYALLSLRTGIFCGAADRYLGQDYFLSKGRANAWDITEEILIKWKQEAIELGVPAERLELTTDEMDLFPQLISAGMALQHKLETAR